MNYHDVFKRSIEDPEGFWGEQAQAIRWYEAPTTVLSQNEQGFYRWFRGGKMNTAYLALDYHVEQGRGKQTALIYDSPVTDTIRKYTYLELRDEVAKFAGVLAGLGVSKGDRVVIYMPMVPEAAIAMLACARLGAVHSVVFGGFAPNELAVRIDDAKPKVMVSASCGIEAGRVIPYKPLLDKSIELAKHKPDYCVILKRPQENASLISGRDYEWNELMTNAAPAECMAVDATDPLYILYTSGTTGKPKGIVRDNGGHAVALRYSMQAIYDVNPGDVFWAGSDVGWVVGHSYIVYAPLLTGCTNAVVSSPNCNSSPCQSVPSAAVTSTKRCATGVPRSCRSASTAASMVSPLPVNSTTSTVCDPGGVVTGVPATGVSATQPLPSSATSISKLSRMVIPPRSTLSKTPPPL